MRAPSRSNAVRLVAGVARLVLLAIALAAPLAAQPDPDYVLIAPLAAVPPGESTTLWVILDSSQGMAIQAGAIGVCSDPLVATPTAAVPGTALSGAMGGQGPDYFVIELFPVGVSISFVVDLLGVDGIPPASFARLVEVEYEATGPAGSVTALAFCGGLTTPPLPVTLYLDPGTAVTPTTVDGSLAIGTPAGLFTFALPPQLALGGTFLCDVVLTAPAPVEAFRFGLQHDDALVDLVATSPSTYLMLLTAGAGPEILLVDIDPEGGTGLTVECSISASAPFTAIPIPVAAVFTVTYEVIVPDALSGPSAGFSIAGHLGAPPVAPEVQVAGIALPAYGIAATVPIGAAFVRGECNGDGATDIADPITLLTALFPPPGTPIPDFICPDACDGNDDGALDIGDAITILTALFAGGAIPGPASCGADPTGDPLPCPESACP